MSNEKMTTDVEPEVPVLRGHGTFADTAKPAKDIKVVSLEIDDDDFGGDPYNRTGSHCVIKTFDDR